MVLDVCIRFESCINDSRFSCLENHHPVYEIILCFIQHFFVPFETQYFWLILLLLSIKIIQNIYYATHIMSTSCTHTKVFKRGVVADFYNYRECQFPKFSHTKRRRLTKIVLYIRASFKRFILLIWIWSYIEVFGTWCYIMGKI